MINDDIKSIVDRYLFKPNTPDTINSITEEIKFFLNKKLDEDVIESYGKIDVRMRDRDTIFINITPEIKIKSKIVKYIYIGETIEKDLFKLNHGQIYEVKCDAYSLTPETLTLETGFKLPQRQSGELGREIFKKLFETNKFITLAQYRDDRINQILED